MYEPEGMENTKKTRPSESTQLKLMKSQRDSMLRACTGPLHVHYGFQFSVFMEFMSMQWVSDSCAFLGFFSSVVLSNSDVCVLFCLTFCYPLETCFLMRDKGSDQGGGEKR